MPVLRPFLVTLGLSLVVVGCGGGGEAGPAGGPPPAGVSVATVVVESVTEWDEFSGRIEAVNRVEVRPRVSGYLDKVHFQEGALVEVGDPLFSIDDREYQAAVAVAEAEVAAAETRLGLAKDELQRGETLREARAISAEQLQRRISEVRTATADLAAARARTESAALNLSFTQIDAPIAGRVGAANVREGNLVSTGETLLTTVVSMDPIHVVFEGDERIYLKYQATALEGGRPSSRTAANPVQVGLASDKDFPYQGVMNFVDNAINPATGTIQGRAVLPNPDGFLIPGLFARVKLVGISSEDAVLINETAVLTDQDRKYVYVVEEDRAVRRDVKLGRATDGLRVVTAGLTGGERVVVNGVRKIFFSGAPVTTREVPMREPFKAAEQ
ncbi:MAG: efflux RND transporter periplasmic adaptor subunit [Pseudomonadota bacterium]